jgi:hypothetical protein
VTAFLTAAPLRRALASGAFAALHEAVESGLLQPQVLSEGKARAVTPGLGWRSLS